VLTALTWLQEAGEIELKPSGSRQRFRLCADAAKRAPTELAEQMETLFRERERRDVERLGEVLDFAADRGCLVRRLLRYFGEELNADCGQCTSCGELAGGTVADEPRIIPASAPPAITTDDVAAIRGLIHERQAALRGPRALARFLCGLTSPATTRARLTRDDRFGLLEQVPFPDVLAQAESLLVG